jgi:hypothetical protein
MLHPDTHLDIVRQRHSDLLREARAGELARQLADARRDERRSFLSRLRLGAKPTQASRPATSS